jgi:hypothetical protein
LLASFLNLLPGRRLRRLPSLAQAHFYDRLFNPIVTLWYLIFQRLQVDCTLQAALADAWAGGADRLRRGLSRKLRSLATTALSDARQRLPLAFLQEVLGLQASRLVGLDPQPQWRGWGLRLMDGSTLRLRPSGDIPKQFPPHRNQSRHSAYWCLVRVVVLFCLHTGAALGYASGALSVSEQVLAARLILENPGLFLYIGDRNFGIFRIAQAARAAGAGVLVRLTQKRARRLLGRSLQLGIFDVLWSPTRHDQQQEGCSSDPVQGRLLVVRVQRPGFRPQTLYLFTSLDAAYPAEELVALYGLRWHIELNLRYLKTQMHLVQLECKSAAMAEKEWVAGLLAYNLIRAVMLCAALKAGLTPFQLSFSAARRHLQHWMEDFGQGQILGLKRWKTLLDLVGKSRLPHRPLGRPPEPRAQRHLRQAFPPLFGSRAKARRQIKKYASKKLVALGVPARPGRRLADRNAGCGFARYAICRLAKHPLKNLVMRFLHPEPPINLPRPMILPFHVQPQPANILLRRRLCGDTRKNSLENALRAELLWHKDTLQPPKIPIPPVAPLISNERLSHDRSLPFRQKINSFGRIAQNRLHPPPHHRRIEPQILRLQRQRGIKPGDHIPVNNLGLAYEKFDARILTALPSARKSKIECASAPPNH